MVNQLRLLWNRRLILILFSILGFTILWSSYQETNRTKDSQVVCLAWVQDQDDPISALNTYYMELLANAGTDQQFLFSDSLYDELTVVEEVQDYLDLTVNYHDRIDQVIAEREAYPSFVHMTMFELARNQIEINCYQRLKALTNVTPGNYTGYERFFTFGVYDVAVLLLIYVFCYFLIVDEREREIGKLVFASRNGGVRYYLTKASFLALSVFVLSMLLQGIRLAILMSLYGYTDWHVAIQSMSGYFAAPWKLTIQQYLVLYVLWKGFANVIISLLVLLICSLSLSDVVTAGVTFALLGSQILLGVLIPDTSGLVYLRDCGLYKLLTPEYWFSAIRIYRLLVVGSTVYTIRGFGLPALLSALLLVIGITVGCLLFHRGLRKSTVSRSYRGISALFRYRSGIIGNELYFILIRKMGLPVAVALILLYACVICDYEPVVQETVRQEGQVVTLLNQKSFADAKDWIEEKESEMEALEMEMINKQIQYSMGEISEMEYVGYCSYVSNQLRLKEIIDEMRDQAAVIDAYQTEHPESEAGFEFTALSGKVYGAEGATERNWLSLLSAFFVTFMMMTLLPGERERGIYPLLCCSKKAGKAIFVRTLILLGTLMVISVVLHGIWLYSLSVRYGTLEWQECAASWAIFRGGISDSMTIGSVLIGEVVLNGIVWMILGSITMILACFCNTTLTAELIGLVGLILIPIIRVLGGNWVTRIPGARLLSFGDQTLTSAYWQVGAVIVLLGVGIFGMERMVRRWCRLKTD